LFYIIKERREHHKLD